MSRARLLGRESNPRSRAPKAREAPFLFVPFSFLRCSDPCGIRTQPLQLERLTTSPEVERAALVVMRAPTNLRSVPGAVGREALESSSAAFQATVDQPSVGARVSATDPVVCCLVPALVRHEANKKARCPCDTGLWQPADLKAKRHKRSGSTVELPVSGRHRFATSDFSRCAQ